MINKQTENEWQIARKQDTQFSHACLYHWAVTVRREERGRRRVETGEMRDER